MPRLPAPAKTFTRYMDTETNEYLADDVGRCNRQEKCGYHVTPRQYFAAHPDKRKAFKGTNDQVIRFNTVPFSLMQSTLKGYQNNHFTQFLVKLFGEAVTAGLIERYRIGTSKHWPGATIFWQTDAQDRVRTGKIMLYDKNTGKRVKQPYNHIAWVHGLLHKSESQESRKSPEAAANTNAPNVSPKHLSNFLLRQCFFGEHLLALDPFSTVAITESEKTAIIASYYYPKFTWLAAGSLEGLSLGKCRVLKNRHVVLFPDINGYAKWHIKALELIRDIGSATFRIDKQLLRSATAEDRKNGIDIADLLIDPKRNEWDWTEDKNVRPCSAPGSRCRTDAIPEPGMMTLSEVAEGWV
ncbi:DUF6371 domain-containing protein [Mucilaginibacter gotjawali]|uniref:DUF6371 domain-containing protein n=1 Tax=Mucilaginibacter gotjawali TaxID=1550579 RepID=UPI0021CF5586|nr:DUF6371 domain-containing protein [Mucilaginibacter gotjawali]